MDAETTSVASGSVKRGLHHLSLLILVVLAAAIGLQYLLHLRVRPAALGWREWAALTALVANVGALGACAALWAVGRWHATGLGPFRFAVIAFTATTAVYLIFFQPFEYGTWGATFSIGGAVFGLALPWVVALWERRPSCSVRALDFLLFHACLIPLLAEAALRVAPRFSNSPLFDMEGLSAQDRLERNRWIPGSPRYGFPLNSRGHYDSEPTPAPREGAMVVTIGDSFSQGIVPYDFHFTTVAERILEGVEVHNVGVVAIGPPEYLVLMREDALPLEPDLIVVNLFLGNDVEVRTELRGRGAWLAPWFNRRDLVSTLVLKRLRALEEERAERAAGAPAVGVADAAEFTNQRYESLDELVEDLPWLLDHTLEEGTFSEMSFARIEKKRLVAGCWVGRSDYTGLFQTLEQMMAAAGDVPLAFLLIPDEFQVEDGLWSRLASIPPAIPPDKLDRDLPQKTVSTWLDERGLPYLDLLPVLRAVAPFEDGKRHLYKLRDTHFNARGNEESGRALAEFLRAQLRPAEPSAPEAVDEE